MEPIHVSLVSEGVPIAQSFAQPTRNGRAVPQNSDHAVSCFHVYSSGPSCDHSEHYRRCSCARRPTGSQQLRRVRGPLTLGAKRKRSLSVSPYVDSHVNNGNITEDVGDHEYDRLRCERCSMIFKEFKRANRHRREVCSGTRKFLAITPVAPLLSKLLETRLFTSRQSIGYPSLPPSSNRNLPSKRQGLEHLKAPREAYHVCRTA
jgi:hypothetical protein